MIQENAKERVRILAFWEKHGTEAAEEAFKVKRRTLYLWQQKLKAGLGTLEALNDGNKAPKKKRKRLWDHSLIEELRRQREEHPNLGKEKLYPLLLPFCTELRLHCPKPRTLGRLIKDCVGLRTHYQLNQRSRVPKWVALYTLLPFFLITAILGGSFFSRRCSGAKPRFCSRPY